MEKRQYPRLGETVFWEKLPNGLTIAVVPRPGFTRKLAYFVTDYGSIHGGWGSFPRARRGCPLFGA